MSRDVIGETRADRIVTSPRITDNNAVISVVHCLYTVSAIYALYAIYLYQKLWRVPALEWTGFEYVHSYLHCRSECVNGWSHFPAAHDMASADYALMWFSLEHSLLSRLISSLSFSLPLSPVPCGSDMITGSFRDKPDTVWTPRSPGEVFSYQTWSTATFCVGRAEDKAKPQQMHRWLALLFHFQDNWKGEWEIWIGIALDLVRDVIFSFYYSFSPQPFV